MRLNKQNLTASIFIVTLIAVAVLLYPTPECYTPAVAPDLSKPSYTPSETHTIMNNTEGNGSTFFATRGSSMNPTMREGQICACKVKEHYLVGDIVIYAYGDNESAMFVSHRIVDITPQGFIVKGDNNPEADPYPVPEEYIICSIEQSAPLKRAVDRVVGWFMP